MIHFRRKRGKTMKVCYSDMDTLLRNWIIIKGRRHWKIIYKKKIYHMVSLLLLRTS
ncbi:unnamed protein product [Nezara viridula]|uniref:Uncharacterized protein n=1 Tax=Nezara viridula TaxID=85310 RepID=A0A9P0EG56_NEZVI|nr:unnamed protein product [Nezara viridula]